MRQNELVAVKVPPDLYAQLKIVSLETGMPITKLLRFAVKDYLAAKYSHIKIEEKK